MAEGVMARVAMVLLALAKLTSLAAFAPVVGVAKVPAFTSWLSIPDKATTKRGGARGAAISVSYPFRGGGRGGKDVHSASATSLSSSTSATEGVQQQQQQQLEEREEYDVDTRVPVTLISGFLGAGKTTLLKKLLENREGLRVGMVVNDIASVNVDAKLMRGDPGDTDNPMEDLPPTVELQNGCVCCTMSEELFVSLFQLVELATSRGNTYNHIVIEASGITEPKAVRSTFQDAESYGNALMDLVRLDTMVTVVDCGEFLDAFTSNDVMMQRTDLGGIAPDGGANALTAEGGVSGVRGQSDAFQQSMDDGSAQRAVVDLLVEQVECADVVVLNKADLVTDDNMSLLRKIINALNPKASKIECEFGQASIYEVLGVMNGEGVAEFGAIDDHKETMESALSMAMQEQQGEAKEGKAGGEGRGGAVAFDPDCAVCQEEHSHSHHDHHEEEGGCGEKEKAVDEGHSSHEGHSHAHGEDETDCSACSSRSSSSTTTSTTTTTTSSSTSSSISGDGSSHGGQCHSHSHSSQGPEATTAETKFGITNFVYKQRRPFHPQRLQTLLQDMPVSTAVAAAAGKEQGGAAGAAAAAGGGGGGAAGEMRQALSRVVRSKGFMWMAHSDVAAFYWSHAGRHHEVQCLGRWWASVPPESWPEGQSELIKEDFGKDNEGEGDRRQEIVFIGMGVRDQVVQDAITRGLDTCLLTDAEMEAYRSARSEGPRVLLEAFPNPIQIRYVK